MTGKLIIFSAPSGSGKSTIINYLLTQNLNLAFSISATSRPPRGTEKHGVEYFFLTPEEFRCRIENNEFLEYEEVYKDRYYGTLKEQVEKQIDTAEDVFGVYHLMTKSYLLAFLKYAEPYLSREDFSKMLADIWIRTEAPNLDPNFKQKELLDLFRQSKQEEMMTEDEIETLRSLPETVSVYRGVSSYNAGKAKALSWTLDQKVAQWFANRFGENGTVYEAEISKEHILALFKGRNEWEVIVEPDHLFQLSEAMEENMEEPQL